jgi:hypothetical protein
VGYLRGVIRFRYEQCADGQAFAFYIYVPGSYYDFNRRPSTANIVGEFKPVHRSRHVDICKDERDLLVQFEQSTAASALPASYTSKPASSIKATAPILIRGSSSTIRTAALGLPRSPMRAKLRPGAKVQLIFAQVPLHDCARHTEQRPGPRLKDLVAHIMAETKPTRGGRTLTEMETDCPSNHHASVCRRQRDCWPIEIHTVTSFRLSAFYAFTWRRFWL